MQLSTSLQRFQLFLRFLQRTFHLTFVAGKRRQHWDRVRIRSPDRWLCGRLPLPDRYHMGQGCNTLPGGAGIDLGGLPPIGPCDREDVPR
jgi:hypothetical protein